MNMDVDVMPTIGKNDVSNFRFIKTYSLGLKPKNGNYYEGMTFNQLNCIAPIQIFVHFFFLHSPFYSPDFSITVSL